MLRRLWHRVKSYSLQDWAHLATIAGIFFGVGALWVAANQAREQADQFRDQVALSREIASNASWEGYMELAFANPAMARGLKLDSLSPDDQERYKWFVEKMLFSGEQILWYTPGDYQWRSTIKTEVSRHISYFESPEFLRTSNCDYIAETRAIIGELSQKARRRNAECLPDYYIPRRRSYSA